MLLRLEATPEIYIFSGSRLGSVYLVIVDEAVGLMVRYTFDITDMQPLPINIDTLRLCFGLEQTTYIEIFVRDPDLEPQVDEYLGTTPAYEDTPYYQSVEDSPLTQMDTETFAEFFRQHPDECLVPLEYREQEGR